MKDIIVYMRSNDIKGIIVDQFNSILDEKPSLTRGMQTRLCLRLMDRSGDPIQASLLNYEAFAFVLANDWDTSTTVQIRCTDTITVAGVTLDEITYSEIRIPLTNINTVELISVLGNSESISLGAELIGIDAGETTPGFVLQFDMKVYNRRDSGGTGSPTEVPDGSYNAAQVDALIADKEDVADKGVANGYASLDSGGKVPSTQLPAYVDDILEVADYASLPTTGETGKIYVTLDDNKTYRWSGSAYVEISESLALGETSETAYRGDHGKDAYDHSQLTGGNPHSVSKSDIGLNNVTNILDKLDATVAPTTDDDSGDGYSVGSRWVDVTNDKIYFCLDATVAAATWQEVGSASGSSPLTTKGDVYVYGSDNARLPVGSNGQVLTADSGESLGAKWATPSSGGGGLTGTILTSISGNSFLYPQPGVTNPFTDASNSPNIGFDVDNYDVETGLLSTTSNEPQLFPLFIVPDCTSLKIKYVCAPENGNNWDGNNVVLEIQHKSVADNSTWSTVSITAVATKTPTSGSENIQIFSQEINLSTLGWSVGDLVQAVIYVKSTSTWAHDIAMQYAHFEVV